MFTEAVHGPVGRVKADPRRVGCGGCWPLRQRPRGPSGKGHEAGGPHTPLQLPQNVAVEYISPAPAVIQAPAPVVEFIQPAPVVIRGPAPGIRVSSGRLAGACASGRVYMPVPTVPCVAPAPTDVRSARISGGVLRASAIGDCGASTSGRGRQRRWTSASRQHWSRSRRQRLRTCVSRQCLHDCNAH